MALDLASIALVVSQPLAQDYKDFKEKKKENSRDLKLGKEFLYLTPKAWL
jgi:hypothetical protein